MEHVLLLVMLAGVTQALFPAAETKCNATHNMSLCSPAVGGSVYIQLMTNASGHRLLCKKQLPDRVISVFTLKKGKVAMDSSFKNRTEFFTNNGTLKISNVTRNDSGQYNVKVYDQNGMLLRDLDFTVDVKENNLPTWIYVCSGAVVLLIVVILCCVVCNGRSKKKSTKRPG